MTNKIEPVAWIIKFNGDFLAQQTYEDFKIAQEEKKYRDSRYPEDIREVVPIYALPEGSKILSAEDVEKIRDALERGLTWVSTDNFELESHQVESDIDAINAAIKLLGDNPTIEKTFTNSAGLMADIFKEPK